jgi:hypothetical protein
MKNLKLGIFVVGTTVMLWLGCSNYTWDTGRGAKADYSLFETGQVEKDSIFSETARTMDELDE